MPRSALQCTGHYTHWEHPFPTCRGTEVKNPDTDSLLEALVKSTIPLYTHDAFTL